MHLLTLPDFCEVYPAHGAGSLCGRAMGASLLKMNGFTNVLSAAGGMTGYSTAGYAPECPVCVSLMVPAF